MSSGERITYFAQTDARGKRVPFGIKEKDRSRHFYLIGKTGMGKSTVLENMAIQDIRAGEGMAFIDPHGKTADLLLDYVPKERIKDVLYFAPFDMDFPVAFNIMEDIGADRRHLVANGLMSTFEKIWVDAWSARMAYILNNTLLALLETPNTTLLGINRMLADKEYRKGVVAHIKDPSVRSFWVDEFSKYTDRYTAEATPAIQNKVGQFASNPLIRNIIGQEKSSFNLRQMMDKRKIIIINLSKGLVGEGNAKLLGSMLVTKMYLAAMSRADVSEEEMKKLPPFYLYVDEFQSFANKSFSDILSEARKYKLTLTLAHQYIEQMEEEVVAAVFGNIGTMATFRVGARDAEFLEKEFAPQFTAEDLVNLGIYQIYLKLMIDGISSPPFSATTLPPLERDQTTYKKEVIEASRSQFSAPRAEVEGKIQKWHTPLMPTPTPRAAASVPPAQNPPPTPSFTKEGDRVGGFEERPPRRGYWQERKREWREAPPQRLPAGRQGPPKPVPPPLPHRTPPPSTPISLKTLAAEPPRPAPPRPSGVGQVKASSALRDALKEALASEERTSPPPPFSASSADRKGGATLSSLEGGVRRTEDVPPPPEEVERVLKDGLPPEPNRP